MEGVLGEVLGFFGGLGFRVRAQGDLVLSIGSRLYVEGAFEATVAPALKANMITPAILLVNLLHKSCRQVTLSPMNPYMNPSFPLIFDVLFHLILHHLVGTPLLSLSDPPNNSLDISLYI